MKKQKCKICYYYTDDVRYGACESCRYRTRYLTKKAIVIGELVRPSKCDKCGKGCYPDAHHTDYMYTHEIEWLCAKCHKRFHVEAQQNAMV